MDAQEAMYIEVEAAKALSQWKLLFAATICDHAKLLAIASGQPHHLTLSQIQQAAQTALAAVGTAIQAEANVNRKAA